MAALTRLAASSSPSKEAWATIPGGGAAGRPIIEGSMGIPCGGALGGGPMGGMPAPRWP